MASPGVIRTRRALLIGSIPTLIIACGTDPCGTNLLKEALSQDGKVKAVAFRRNCGATTDYVTAVSLVSAHEDLTHDGRFFTPRRLGNVFRADGAGPIDMAWRSATELVIRYGPGAAPLLRESSRGKIRIRYEELTPRELAPQNSALKLAAPLRSQE
ncbi:MAG TPA: hypothetical protein VGM03_16310 [Phycisphaerae bacterium]|jgi:hypothetical protein